MVRFACCDPSPFITIPSWTISVLAEPVPLTNQVTVTPV